MVCFPDDDCWYPPETLARVQRRFEAEPGLDGLTGITTDGAGHRTSARWQRRAGPIDRFNVWTCAISCTIFLRRQMVERAGTFDPRLGPGGDPGRESGDETDYLLQVLARGGRLVFDPGLEVFHLDPVQQIDAAALDRIARYAGGAGLVLRKHDFPLWFVAYFCARPLGGSMVAALRGQPTRARYHLRVLSGRLQGWRAGT